MVKGGSMLGAIVILGLVVGLVLVLTVLAAVRHDRLAPIGEEIVWDDFGFKVLDVRRMEVVGPAGGEAKAKGAFWIIDLEVANHAKRVGYRLESHKPILVAGDGREFPVSPEGQTAHDLQRGAAPRVDEIAHGERCTTPLVFDVPADARDVILKISWGKIGDVLDWIVLGERRLALP